MLIRSAVVTDIGRKRESNEDYCSTLESRHFYVVADGLGGHAAGRVASETGTIELVRQVGQVDGPPDPVLLRAAMRAAHTRILSLADRDSRLRGMATTIAALWLGEAIAWLAHVGDSRIYLLRDGRIRQLTVDHSLVRELVSRRELSADAMNEHPDRHVITRALGVRNALEPDIASIATQPGDRFVMCTDGLTSQVRDKEIAAVLLDCDEDLPQAAEVLVELANMRGGEDNTTVILVHLAPAP